MQEINLALFHFFNDLASMAFFEIMVSIFVDLPIFVLPVFLLGYWIYYTYFSKNKGNKEAKNNLLLIFYSTVLALIISLIIQQFVHLDRPEEHMQAGAKLLLDHLPDASFPSDHATVSIAFLAAIFFAGYRKWGMILAVPFTLMNISRVIAGVHWPFDIIAGSLVGIVGAYIVFSHLSQIKFVKNLNLWIINILKHIKL